MPGLNLQHDEPRDSKKSKNKMLKVVLGIGVLIAVPVIGTTLAASINVNSGSVQFGQGVSQATACDSAITVTPSTTFANAQNSGSFKLSSVAISDIAGTCDTKRFTIKVFGDSSSTPLTVSTGTGTDTALLVTYDSDGSTTALVESGGAIDYTLASQSSTSFTIDIVTTVAAADVYKITVETS